MGNGERGIVRWGEKFFSPTSRTSTDAFAAHPHDFWGTRVKRKTVARMVFTSRNVREVCEVFCFRCLEIRSFGVLEIFSKGFIILPTPSLPTPSLPTPSLPPQPFSAPLREKNSPLLPFLGLRRKSIPKVPWHGVWLGECQCGGIWRGGS